MFAGLSKQLSEFNARKNLLNIIHNLLAICESEPRFSGFPRLNKIQFAME